MIDLKNLSRSQIIDWATARGHSAYRGRQIFAWLYRPAITMFSQMTDLSKKFRLELAEIATISTLPYTLKETSSDGTMKYGFTLIDNHIIEAVLIPEEDRNTLCVSSQVGCAMGCRFCLTGTMGFTRNLTPAEIVGQICTVQEDLDTLGMGSVTNLVFMGMGEPLANFENLITALEILLDDLGLSYSSRRTTVSTCGLAPKIIELGNRIKVNLAISLHGADDKIRSQLMPVNDTYPIADIIDACRQFPLQKRKRIMFEYILLKGINDSDEDAEKLGKLLRPIPCKINLLPCNEAPELPYKKPSNNRVHAFQKILRDMDYTVFIRTSRGDDISAACGQLANKHRKQNI
jgi:23S rRNA (adenine2503-C2)-methyltransferase